MKVIVDASNVAHYGKDTEETKPSLNNLMKALEALEKLGYEPFPIADASLRHEIDEKDKLNTLIEEGKIQQVPSGTTADHFILKIAEDEDCKILSNDNFREYFDEFRDINNRRIPFKFIKGDIIIGTSSKPKKNSKYIAENMHTDVE